MKTRSNTFQLLAETPSTHPDKGLTRNIMAYDGQLMVVRVHFDKGAIGTLHEHFHSQCTYVVSGKFEVSIGEEKKVLSAGDAFYVEPDLIHGAVCLEEGVLIDVFSPARMDFLGK